MNGSEGGEEGEDGEDGEDEEVRDDGNLSPYAGSERVDDTARCSKDGLA